MKKVLPTHQQAVSFTIRNKYIIKTKRPHQSYPEGSYWCGPIAKVNRRIQATLRTKVPRIPGLLATENPTDAIPGAAEPEPDPDPATAVPVDAVDVGGKVGVAIVGEDEDHLAAEGDRNVGLVGEEPLPFALALVGVERLGPLDHGVADHQLLLALMEREDVVGDAANGHFGGNGLVDELLSELTNPSRVGRVNESRKALVAELPLQVGDRSQEIHDLTFPFAYSYEQTTPYQHGKEEVLDLPAFFSIYLVKYTKKKADDC